MTTHDPAFAPTVDSDIVRTSTATKPERLLSLDVLRGLTIAFMITVNAQTGPKPFLELSHAAWNGFTATDLVFPTFLLLVGLSTVLSTAARMSRGATRKELFLHALRRTFVLFLAGFVVNNFPLFHMQTARYYGVLPRIAICYFVVATLYLISPAWKDKVVIALACLVGYWALLRFVTVPGYGMPTHDMPINDPTGNLTAYIDRSIFSPAHLYERVRDPEGLVSTIPAIATALFGMLAGLWLRSAQTTRRKAVGIAIAGVIFLATALAWHPYFPMNKKLWTSSFALFAGGWSLLLLALSIYIVDLLRVGRSTQETNGRPTQETNDPASPLHPLLYRPLLVFGTNAILAYMVSELGDSILSTIPVGHGVSLKGLVSHAFFNTVHDPRWASLLFSLTYMFICWLVVLPFYRKRIFLRI